MKGGLLKQRHFSVYWTKTHYVGGVNIIRLKRLYGQECLLGFRKMKTNTFEKGLIFCI